MESKANIGSKRKKVKFIQLFLTRRQYQIPLKSVNWSRELKTRMDSLL
jgi:hypothetical protein